MYSIDLTRLAQLRTQKVRVVGPNVPALGATSLLTDVSSEMVASILPAYFVLALGMSPLQFGVIDGLYQGGAAAAGLLGGLLADRWNRHRLLAAIGYGLSAACKLALLAAGAAWTLLAGTIALDRVGKGLRTAPRDALISFGTSPEHLGFAFGLHRALDTAGALLGPLVAFAILAGMPDAFDVVFVTSFFIALAGLAVLLLFVSAGRAGARADRSAAPAARSVAALWQNRRFRRLALIGGALALVAVPDSFVYLAIQQRTGMPAGYFPLLPVASATAFLLAAIPAGRLADAFGRARVFVAGYAMLLGAGLLLWSGEGSTGAWCALGLLGLFYACTDGVLMAAASACLPETLRGAGLGLLVSALALGRLGASMLFGAAWNAWGIGTALALFAAALAAVLAAVAWRGLRLEPARGVAA